MAAPWPVSGLLILGGAGALPGVVRGLVLGLGLTFIAIVAGLPAPAVEAAALAAGSPAEPGISANSVRYTVTVPVDPTDPVEVRLQIPTPPAVVELQFPDPSGGGGRLQAIRANRDDGEALPVERVAAGGFRLPTLGARHVTVTYSLNLSPSLWNPATWPGQELASVRSDGMVWLVGRDALLQVAGPAAPPAELVLQLPAGWRAFLAGAGLLETDRPLAIAPGQEPVLLLGPMRFSRYPVPGGQLTVIVSPEPPWEPGQLAWSVQAVLEGLAARGVTGPPADLTLAVLRYPAALRLNPLVGSQRAPGPTIVHWVGTGSLNWWRKHAARDVVDWYVEHTLRLAPDARWLQPALAEYAALALLFDTGFLTVDDMYQSLRALHSNGLHYSGPAWPSLVSAGLEAPPSHASQRVLAFRAPLVALLMDMELWDASGSTLFDLWARLIAAQQEGPAATFHTAAVLAPLADMGVGSAFAQAHIYGNRMPPADFDGLFQRWFDQHAR